MWWCLGEFYCYWQVMLKSAINNRNACTPANKKPLYSLQTFLFAPMYCQQAHSLVSDIMNDNDIGHKPYWHLWDHTGHKNLHICHRPYCPNLFWLQVGNKKMSCMSITLVKLHCSTFTSQFKLVNLCGFHSINWISCYNLNNHDC